MVAGDAMGGAGGSSWWQRLQLKQWLKMGGTAKQTHSWVRWHQRGSKRSEGAAV